MHVPEIQRVFAIRYERLVGMLPDCIQQDYRKKGSIDKLEKMYYTGVIMNYETLCQGEILFPKKLSGYSLVKFVDDALNKMEKGGNKHIYSVIS